MVGFLSASNLVQLDFRLKMQDMKKREQKRLDKIEQKYKSLKLQKVPSVEEVYA